jgi:hypothetical protein
MYWMVRSKEASLEWLLERQTGRLWRHTNLLLGVSLHLADLATLTSDRNEHERTDLPHKQASNEITLRLQLEHEPLQALHAMVRRASGPKTATGIVGFCG